MLNMNRMFINSMNELDIDTISNFYFPKNQSNDISISYDSEKILVSICENCVKLLKCKIFDYGNLNSQGRVNDLSNIMYGNENIKMTEKISDFILKVKKFIIKNIESSNNQIKKIITKNQIDFEIENLLIAIMYEGTDSSMEDEVNFCNFINCI